MRDCLIIGGIAEMSSCRVIDSLNSLSSVPGGKMQALPAVSILTANSLLRFSTTSSCRGARDTWHANDNMRCLDDLCGIIKT
jgi:hypothetical protein